MPGEKSWQSTAGFMTHVTCRLTAKNRNQLRNPTLGNRVRATFTFTLYHDVPSSQTLSLSSWRRVADLCYCTAVNYRQRRPRSDTAVSTAADRTSTLPQALTSTRWAKRARPHRLMTAILSNLNRFKIVFSGRFPCKFAVKWMFKILTHLATLEKR